jgi:hypothetical protein
MAIIYNLTEDPQNTIQVSAWVGDWHTYVVRLVDELGSPVDITTGTLSATFTNINTGAAYSFGGGSTVLTKQYSAQGIVSVLNPMAYPTAAEIRLTISFTVGTTVRRFGPLQITVLAP